MIAVERGLVLVTVGGWGFRVADYRRHRAYFSERNGFVPTLRLSRHWRLNFYRPDRGTR